MSIDATTVAAWIRDFQAAVGENKEMLTELDSAIGDADHGINMDRGMTAVVAKLPEGDDIGQLLKTVGMTLISTVGGSGGPLYGSFFMQAGNVLAGRTELTADDWLAALDAGIAGVQKIGKSEAGQKTMLDALIPARDAFASARRDGADMALALSASAEAADAGKTATIPMLALKGRASYLGERSIGHQDPGATSSALLIRAAERSFATTNGGR